MRKRMIAIVAIIGMIGISSSFTEPNKNDNAVKTPSELVKSALKSFALAPERAAKGIKTDISGHVSIFQRFLATDESDLPLNVSGLSGGRAAEFNTVVRMSSPITLALI